VSKLRPGYNPPNRKTLRSTLLDKVHGSLSTVVAKSLQGKEVTLIQDGWSDIHNSPVIAHTASQAFFLSRVKTGANKKTAEYCGNLATNAMKEAAAKLWVSSNCRYN